MNEQEVTAGMNDNVTAGMNDNVTAGMNELSLPKINCIRFRSYPILSFSCVPMPI